jgi:hypothetical protein
MSPTNTMLIIAIGVALVGCSKPDPEEIEFRKKFAREAVLVKTCRPDPGIESGVPLKIYRFQQEFWFDDRGNLRRVDGTLENVCDLLDTEQKAKGK